MSCWAVGYGGTIQINNFGNTGGEIVNNAATILLDGPDSSFVDMAGKNALSNFSNNEAAGSFTIQDGRNFTGPNNVNFANAGIVNIGAGSTFATGGTGDYNQSGGSTQLNGMLTAGGGTANFNGGVLFGNGGVINGNVMMGGTIVPAGSIGAMNMPITAGMLTINGNYTQAAGGIFNLGLGGLGAGTQFGLLSISGNATLDGTLNVSLINGFFPTSGDVFKFLTTGGSVSNEFANANGLNIGGGLQLDVIYGSNFVELTTMALTNTDLWLGGTGNWSNGAKWSIGVPTPPDNVFIYSGGNDLVTLDTAGSNNVNALTVGGATNGFSSELTDGGVARTLTIASALTVGQQGTLYFSGSGSSITAATVTNEGFVNIGKGATLNLTGQPLGVTDVPTGAIWTIGGNFEVGGVADTGFANLASIEGAVELQNGQSWTIAPSLLTISGTMDVSNGTTVTIMADVNNSGLFTTGDLGTGGNTLTIAGTLTNDGYFAMFGAGDMANISGDLDNHVFGTVDLEGGSTLNVTGNFDNRGLLESYQSRGNTVNIAAGSGTLTNEAGGIIDVESGSELTINGNVINNSAGVDRGILTGFDGIGGNTLNITGTLTNSGHFELLGSKDMSTLGSLTNNAGGFVDVEGGSTLNITGDVTNSSSGSGMQGIFTSFNGTGHNAINIGGTLTNNGMVGIESTGDALTVTGDVTNNSGAEIAFTGGSMGTFKSDLTNNVGATVDLENASTLTIKGNADNSGTLGTSLFNGTGGNSLSIDGALTNSGIFAITGHLDSAAVGSITNNSGGLIDLEHGSSLCVAGNVTNSGEFDTSDLGQGGGNVVIVNGSFTNNSGGLLQLLALKDQVTLGSLTNNAGGFVDVENGATLTVNGDVTNNAGGGGKNGIFTTYNTIAGNGGATIDITGTLTNSGTFQLNGPGDMATIGNGVTNNATGTIDVEGGSTLSITGDVTNDGELFTGLHNAGINNALNITGTLTNSGGFGTRSHGDVATLGGLDNSGSADVEDGSKLQINGDATNSGTILTSSLGGSSHDTLNITGNLTNSGTFELEGVGDMSSIGGNVTNSGEFGLFASGAQATIGGNVINSNDFSVADGSMVTVKGSFTNNDPGFADLEGGSTLTINGDATNNATTAGRGLFTGYFGSGGNTLTIDGMLTNNGNFGILGPGDTGTVGSLTNNSGAQVDVEGGSTLTILGDVTNSSSGTNQGIYTSLSGTGGNTINIGGMLTNSGTFELAGNSDMAAIGGNVTNSGGFSLGGKGDVLTVTGTLTNSGAFELNGNSDMATLASLANSGFVGVENGSKLQINGAATNSGSLDTSDFGTGGSTITVSGLLTNTATGTITLNGPGDVLSALAGLSNSGVINVNNGSSILPPFFDNLGTLNIDGTSRFVVGTPTPMGGQGYIQTANGTLGEMIASLNSFGVINVNGSALLNGTLNVLLQGGYNPDVGSMYKFLNFTPGELSGMFANIPANGMFDSDGEQWLITYDNADGYVELTAEGRQVVSEPGTLLVLIPGLLGMGYGLRRRLLK